jgi:hypothetical protein
MQKAAVRLGTVIAGSGFPYWRGKLAAEVHRWLQFCSDSELIDGTVWQLFSGCFLEEWFSSPAGKGEALCPLFSKSSRQQGKWLAGRIHHLAARSPWLKHLPFQRRRWNSRQSARVVSGHRSWTPASDPERVWNDR